MDVNQFFSTARFGHLLKRELAQNKKMGLLVAAVVFIILCINALSCAYNRDNDFHEVMYPFFLLVGGIILTSLAFTEMNRVEGKQFYLTLPASNAEKYFGKWLLTGLGFALIFTIGYWLFSFIGNGLGNVFFDHNLGSFHPFSEENRLYFQLYLAIQTIFLLGAVYFRKFAVFKTALSTVVFAFIFALFSFLSFRLLFNDMFDGWFNIQPQMEINGKMVGVRLKPSSSSDQFFEKYAEGYFRLIGLWLIPAVLLAVGYYKLKETEL